ncbi:uncharacterized protein LOC133785396 [Humulus lupulus]|uniref:uncharacterized protein LOC133785396 n=1 Tax=Humulus lupulus TaxID=3486 RepID=UPI002B4046BE|nr:uncharacterized protein LOC133785396 [Humulus lupulus]
MAKNDAVIQSQAASLRNLETQLGQLANELRNRPQGTLPNDTENPRNDGKEHCKAVTLRSGKNLELTEDNCTRNSEPTSIQSSVDKGDKAVKSKNLNADPEAIVAAIPPQNAIGRPIKALEQMPNYVKFLKDILTKKRRLGEFETIVLTEGCSAILKSKIPPKLKDPGSFTIPISIGGRELGKALCDLGGKIEDVLVQVDKFIFPAEFIILDYEEDRDEPIILGRPFLATGRTLIDVEKGELTIRAQDEQVTFKVFNPIRSPNEVEACLAISVSNFKLIEKMHGKYSNGVKKKVPFEEIEKGGEPWISKEEEPSHSP